MRHNIANCWSWPIVASIVLIFFSGCAIKTKPNPVYQGLYPERFSLVLQKNAMLAKELLKLHEFQDGISPSEATALEKIIDLYEASPEQFDKVFKEMYQIGLPEVRKYCSPLQAFFWLLEKGEYQGEKVRLEYSLQSILVKAWDFAEGGRWRDYQAVTDRLNAPELVNYYQRARFSYEFGRRDEKNAYYLFKANKGNCSDFTAFSIYCLQKAGYRAWEEHVASPSGRHPYHIVCVFESNGKKYIMDNGRPDKLVRRGIIPYEEYDPF